MAPSAELFLVSADVDGEGVESDAWVLDLDAQRGEAVGFSSAGAMMCRAGRSACSQPGFRGLQVSNSGPLPGVLVAPVGASAERVAAEG